MSILWNAAVRWVANPDRFMNSIGLSSRARSRPRSVVTMPAVVSPPSFVVHDEIDLELGMVRLKSGGGHGGHNGLRSLMEQLGGNGFARLRMGVGRDPNARPGAKDAAGWVLADFPPAQADLVERMVRAGCEDIETVLAKGIKDAMNQHNARPSLST